jgi:hypothetical protein
MLYALFLVKLPTWGQPPLLHRKAPGRRWKSKEIELTPLPMWERTKGIIRQAKGLYDWYSFAPAIVSWISLTGLLSVAIVFVSGIVGAIIKGVPWPITLMACVAILLAGACLIALPIFIRAAMPVKQPVSQPTIADEPIRPHWDAWKHYERFDAITLDFMA